MWSLWTVRSVSKQASKQANTQSHACTHWATALNAVACPEGLWMHVVLHVPLRPDIKFTHATRQRWRAGRAVRGLARSSCLKQSLLFMYCSIGTGTGNGRVARAWKRQRGALDVAFMTHAHRTMRVISWRQVQYTDRERHRAAGRCGRCGAGPPPAGQC
jgi:hypothetical protein